MPRRDGTKTPSVAANTALLPEGWQHDTLIATEAWAKIRRLRARGLATREIARQVGCTDRTVLRVIGRPETAVVTYCGAKRFNRAHPNRTHEPCMARVRREGDRCGKHRGQERERVT